MWLCNMQSKYFASKAGALSDRDLHEDGAIALPGETAYLPERPDTSLEQ